MYLKRLRDLREDIDAKQATIAEVLKITRQQYSLYELDYILELTDEIKPYKKSSN